MLRTPRRFLPSRVVFLVPPVLHLVPVVLQVTRFVVSLVLLVVSLEWVPDLVVPRLCPVPLSRVWVAVSRWLVVLTRCPVEPTRVAVAVARELIRLSVALVVSRTLCLWVTRLWTAVCRLLARPLLPSRSLSELTRLLVAPWVLSTRVSVVLFRSSVSDVRSTVAPQVVDTRWHRDLVEVSVFLNEVTAVCFEVTRRWQVLRLALSWVCFVMRLPLVVVSRVVLSVTVLLHAVRRVVSLVPFPLSLLRVVVPTLVSCSEVCLVFMPLSWSMIPVMALEQVLAHELSLWVFDMAMSVLAHVGHPNLLLVTTTNRRVWLSLTLDGLWLNARQNGEIIALMTAQCERLSALETLAVPLDVMAIALLTFPRKAMPWPILTMVLLGVDGTCFEIRWGPPSEVVLLFDASLVGSERMCRMHRSELIRAAMLMKQLGRMVLMFRMVWTVLTLVLIRLSADSICMLTTPRWLQHRLVAHPTLGVVFPTLMNRLVLTVMTVMTDRKCVGHWWTLSRVLTRSV